MHERQGTIDYQWNSGENAFQEAETTPLGHISAPTEHSLVLALAPLAQAQGNPETLPIVLGALTGAALGTSFGIVVNHLGIKSGYWDEVEPNEDNPQRFLNAVTLISGAFGAFGGAAVGAAVAQK